MVQEVINRKKNNKKNKKKKKMKKNLKQNQFKFLKKKIIIQMKMKILKMQMFKKMERINQMLMMMMR